MLRAGITPSIPIEVANREVEKDGEESRGFLTSLGLGQIVSWGTLYYSYPLIAEAMSQEMKLSKSEVYGAATAGLLASACFAYPVGKAIDRGHGRTVLVTGSLLAGLLLSLWSQVTATPLFYSIVLLLGVAQAMTLYEAAFAVIAGKTLRRQIAHSITRLTLWGGFASTVFIPLAEILIQEFGWRNALVVFGVFNFTVAGLYALTFPKRKGPRIEEQYREGSILSRIQMHPVHFALKSQIVWALLISFALYSIVFAGLTFHIYPLFAARNLSTATVAAGIALLGPAQVLGRLLIWKFSSRIKIAQSGRYVLFAFPVSLLAVIFLNPFAALITFVLTYGIANGIMTIIRGTAVAELLTIQRYGVINSLISVPSTVCKALGPFTLAYFFQRSGSYEPLMIGLLFATALILISYWYATLRVVKEN